MNNLPIQTYESVVQQRDELEKKLLAYEQAAKNPIGSFHISGGQVEATTDYCRDGEWPVQDGEVLVYAVPVLPKQPELIGMKVSIDTGSDNIGHRLFGEIVGTSESNGVPVLCIEVTENNVDVAAPAQPVIPERPELRYGDNVLWFLNELAAFDASDIDSDDFDVYGEDRNGIEGCATISITELAADAAKLLSAQPVSNPYKLPDNLDFDCEFENGDYDIDEEPWLRGRVDGFNEALQIIKRSLNAKQNPTAQESE
ncbi:hypothetical protein HMPREF0864_02224 [Enterobacteriaceae bacterium 9_2_54FAA]|nr:hypothetical protein HMPREF0864_02224 [Enterobacteriaceae bacterium 9_2_54FAA]